MAAVVSEPGTTSSGSTRSSVVVVDTSENTRAKDICSGYLQGQIANVAKAAFWWSTFGVAAEALSSKVLALGLTRCVFNLALVTMSPLAGAVAERASLRILLNTTTLGRGIIWCLIIPATWIACHLKLIQTSFLPLLIVIMLFDGILVSFANVVDIDCGGLESLAHQYQLSIGSYLSERFHGIHQLLFDTSFIILTPPISLLVWGLHKHFSPSNSSGSDVIFLIGGISITFGILTLISLWFYTMRLPPRAPALDEDIPSTLRGSCPGNTGRLRLGIVRLCGGCFHFVARLYSNIRWVIVLTLQRLSDVFKGYSILIAEPPLGWRVVFLALETALEDAIVSVILPQIAINVVESAWNWDRVGGWTLANCVAALLIAVGKSGGLMSAAMTQPFSPPIPTEICNAQAYSHLFRYMWISSATVLLFPAAYYLLLLAPPASSAEPNECLLLGFSCRTVSLVGSALTASLGSFLFFVFSTAPKIGFATLLHSLVLNSSIDPKVFGFVGTFVTLSDAAIILGMNYVFYYFGHGNFIVALLVVAVIYLAHGMAELLLAPKVILRTRPVVPRKTAADEDVNASIAEAADFYPGYPASSASTFSPPRSPFSRPRLQDTNPPTTLQQETKTTAESTTTADQRWDQGRTAPSSTIPRRVSVDDSANHQSRLLVATSGAWPRDDDEDNDPMSCLEPMVLNVRAAATVDAVGGQDSIAAPRQQVSTRNLGSWGDYR